MPKKPQIKPIITGVRPIQKERKIIKLHNHPEGIMKSVIFLKDEAENEQLHNLFEDIAVLLQWALDRLPIVPPKKEDNDHSQSSSQDMERKDTTQN